MGTLFWSKVRVNPVIRAVCLPYLKVKRMIGFKKYQNSEDSQYIKKLKNICNGERCFIIGNGPSLSGEDLNLLTNEKTFACNRIYQMYQYTKWRPTYYMVIDSSVLQKLNHEKERALEAGTVFFANEKAARKYKNQNAHQIILKDVASIHKMKPLLSSVCEDVSQYFSIAQSVIIDALELAFYMGFKEIYLLGLDHSFPIEIDMNGKKYIDRGVKAHFKEDSDKSLFFSYKEALTKEYEICGSYAKQHGIKIINVTRGGKLEVFERDTLENVLQRC